MWLVEHRDGYCVAKRRPPQDADSIETKCNHFVILPWSVIQEDSIMVTCEECLAAIGKEINLPKLAKKLAPAVEKAICRTVLDRAAKIDIGDFVYDVMGKDFYKTMEKVLIAALKTRLKN